MWHRHQGWGVSKTMGKVVSSTIAEASWQRGLKNTTGLWDSVQMDWIIYEKFEKISIFFTLQVKQGQQ